MGPIDIPEVLIAVGFVGCVALAVYNWMHAHHGAAR